ncbi:SAM-dependent methyltransferase YafE (UbiE-like protein) [Candidatus Rhodobacter oscarellae]|uniref:SAM-dependent methyltransferase YafE (UbiE-like protein) n=1 Tax=Candidatus Rhodobacter oscarellae TaxID=1675527 RepID=A0A0J9GW01_9RHOB|nr:class I SAM-dependent methyltransferase [Candidatus Rhodobacter lobularis]KMW57743.1 SAM-dependent methyltransferase YafE (UbiE-like protein) [Candidatus Rhodobacter lobularis]
MKTDTAHEYWNGTWSDEERRAKWETPDPRIVAYARSLPPNRRVLDLGCGVGRHALYYAAAGHQVAAIDAAPDGLAELDQAAAAAGLRVETRLTKMDALPFDDQSFDHVLSFNVIYHADEEILSRTIAEIHRVLRPGGSYQGTMLTHRGLAMTQAELPGGREVSRNTWVFEDDIGDKRHPHHFCRAADIVRLFAGFEVMLLEDEVLDPDRDGHWHLILERV